MIERTIQQICDYIEHMRWECSFKIKDRDQSIRGVSSLDEYQENTVTWVKAQDKVRNKNLEKTSLVIAQMGCELNAPNIIYAAESKTVFFSVIDNFLDPVELSSYIGRHTVIGNEVHLCENVYIGNNCSIVGKIHIGRNCVIGDNVVINNCVSIGENTVVQPGCIIGIDGFGYYEDENHRNKTMIRHHGGVRIGSNVFIGSHTNIARGTLGDTIIGDDSKIAPSTHIGHNNLIGESATIICADLYGSVTLGDNAYVTACAIKNQCRIGENSLVGMGAMVLNNIPDNQVVVGIPAKYLKNRYSK